MRQRLEQGLHSRQPAVKQRICHIRQEACLLGFHQLYPVTHGKSCPVSSPVRAGSAGGVDATCCLVLPKKEDWQTGIVRPDLRARWLSAQPVGRSVGTSPSKSTCPRNPRRIKGTGERKCALLDRLPLMNSADSVNAIQIDNLTTTALDPDTGHAPILVLQGDSRLGRFGLGGRTRGQTGDCSDCTIRHRRHEGGVLHRRRGLGQKLRQPGRGL